MTIKRLVLIFLFTLAIPAVWTARILAEDTPLNNTGPILEEEEGADFNLFQEGLIFEYVELPNGGAYAFKFDGTTVENEHTYHNLACIKTGRTSTHYQNDEFYHALDWTSELPEYSVVPMRQEGSQVLMLVPEQLRDEQFWESNYFFYYTPDLKYDLPANGWEIPLCDYNCEVGDTFITLLDKQIAELKILWIEEIDFCGRKRKGYHIDIWGRCLEGNLPPIIEDMGICSGFPYSLILESIPVNHIRKSEPMGSEMKDWWTALPGDVVRLYRIEDKDGNTVYEAWPTYGTGLQYTSDESIQKGISSVYDLYGQRVTTPQPGGVYIRDGKKFVWPR